MCRFGVGRYGGVKRVASIDMYTTYIHTYVPEGRPPVQLLLLGEGGVELVAEDGDVPEEEVGAQAEHLVFVRESGRKGGKLGR